MQYKNQCAISQIMQKFIACTCTAQQLLRLLPWEMNIDFETHSKHQVNNTDVNSSQ